MDAFVDTIKSIMNVVGNVIVVMLFLLLVYMFISDFVGFSKMIKMVLNLYRSNKKEVIIKHLDFLLKINDEFVDKVATFSYIDMYNKNQIETIITKYTIATQEAHEYGVVKKSATKYYTDLQKACVDSKDQLNMLAFALAASMIKDSHISRNINSYVIVGQSAGNILLANRVANILGMRFVIVGSLAGKKDDVFGTYTTKDKGIIIDDILFTGGMLEKTITTLFNKSIICDRVFALIKRSTEYQKVLAQLSTALGVEIIANSILTIFDNEMGQRYK